MIMKRTVKRTFSIMIVLVMSIMLLACGDKKVTLEGTWTADNGTIYVFNSDGTGRNTMGEISMDFTYEKTETELKISIEILGQKQESTYKYTIEDKTLTLEANGNKEEYKKQ